MLAALALLAAWRFQRQVPTPAKRRKLDKKRVIKVTGARANNLKKTAARIPTGRLSCITGVSGAGKSSLLKIMAGLDDGFSGEARLTPGFTVGYLAQEPSIFRSLRRSRSSSSLPIPRSSSCKSAADRRSHRWLKV